MRQTKLPLKMLALVACLLCSMSAAAQEAYACYTSDNHTLTFYYDSSRPNRPGTTYDLNQSHVNPGWLDDGTYLSVTNVVFKSSFSGARPTSTFGWFAGMENLTNSSFTGLNYLKTVNVTDMSYMFQECSELTNLDAVLSYLNTTNVTDMSCMFYGCASLTSLDLSNFNTANVTNMSGLFANCYNLESINLSNFNTANVTDISALFYSCSSLTSLDLSSFSTAKVTSMYNMFNGCASLTSLDLSSFNTAKVTDMDNMFNGCTALTNLELSSFNTAKVTDMDNMFNGCSELVTVYAGNGWSTSAVTSSTDMFKNCTKIKGSKGTTYNANYVDKTRARIDGGTSNPGYLSDVTPYAVYTPENTTMTFYCDKQRHTRPGTAYDLNTGRNDPSWGSVTDFVTSVVFDPSFANARPETTRSWFAYMSRLTSITGIHYLNTSQVTSMYDMFFKCSSLTSLDLSGFNTANVTNMDIMFEGCSSLTSLDLSSFNTANVTSMMAMFCDCTTLQSIYVGNEWSTAAVTASGGMFLGCTSLVGDMGTTYDANHISKAYAHIDGGPSNPGYLSAHREAYAEYTESNQTLKFYYDSERSLHSGQVYFMNEGGNVPGWYGNSFTFSITTVVFDPSFAYYRPTTTAHWFEDMSKLETIVGMEYLNTSEVTNMTNMFNRCKLLTDLDLRSFNTANVTDMSYMFNGCQGLTCLNVSSFNTANVTNMYDMFYGCKSLTSIDVRSFNTANVTNMAAMFFGCNSLTSLGLGSFNTAQTTNMASMFYNCNKLKTIYVGDGWSTEAVTSSSSMFKNCTSLVGGQGTTYDANHMDAAYAHIDGGPSNPGYFTAKVNFLRGDVNGDGQVKIGDVTTLINYLLSGDASGINLQAADCNQDGNIKIGDVTTLINYLLSGTW